MPANALYDLITRRFPTPAEHDDALYDELSRGRLSRFIAVLVLAIAGPLLEEVFFRGALFRPLRRRYEASGVIFATSLFFAASHLEWQMIAPIAIVGLALGSLRSASGSLVPSFVMHGVFNGITLYSLLARGAGSGAEANTPIPRAIAIGGSVAHARPARARAPARREERVGRRGAAKGRSVIEPGSAKTPKTALCLPGGGLTGALYQIGALAALADGVLGLDGQSFSFYLGHSSGATVSAALAGGITVDRLYRALLDPVDNFFPLERGHLFRVDVDEWRRALATSWVALRHAAARLSARRDAPVPETPGHLYLWEQIDRMDDSLPAGLFTLDRYERFLAEFFLRRGIPNAFRAVPRPLRIPVYDVDSGERVVFGAEGHEDMPVSLACAASLALPPFFRPCASASSTSSTAASAASRTSTSRPRRASSSRSW